MRVHSPAAVRSPPSAARWAICTSFRQNETTTSASSRNANCICVAQAVSLLEEVITPRKELPPLLLKLSERRAERLDYLGVSYGLTTQLLKYDTFTWKETTRRTLDKFDVDWPVIWFPFWQVLEEGRLHPCVPETNSCEWRRNIPPHDFWQFSFFSKCL